MCRHEHDGSKAVGSDAAGIARLLSEEIPADLNSDDRRRLRRIVHCPPTSQPVPSPPTLVAETVVARFCTAAVFHLLRPIPAASDCRCHRGPTVTMAVDSDPWLVPPGHLSREPPWTSTVAVGRSSRSNSRHRHHPPGHRPCHRDHGLLTDGSRPSPLSAVLDFPSWPLAGVGTIGPDHSDPAWSTDPT